MASNLPSPLALLLLFLVLGVSLSAHLGLISAAARAGPRVLAQLKISHPPAASSPCARTVSAKGSGIGLQLAERYGPRSPLNQQPSSSSTSQPLASDQSRVRHLNSLMMTNAADQNLGEGTKVSVGWSSIGDGNYVVKVGLGTPKQDYWLILDTGSDITWMQCQPCSVHCYPQQDPIFNPSNSSTFANATCSSSSCNYISNYVDKSYSKGYFAQDTLALSDSEQYPNFVFGCGQDNSNDFGTAAGILGVGMGDVSLVSQIAPVQIFCYCLPGTEGSDGFFVFGLQALESCDTTNLVPFTRNQQRRDLFFVDFVGITIGEKRIDIPTNSGGTILDSGTVISRLPPSVYTALVAEFRQLMSGYQKAEPSPPLLDVCYDLGGKSGATFPSMRLHFGSSVDVSLGPSGGVRQQGNSKWCLAFAPNERDSDLIIIGNNQQRDFRMLHNVQDGMIGFGEGGCNIGG